MKIPVVGALIGAVTVPLSVSFTDQTATYLPARQFLYHGTFIVPTSAISLGAREEFHGGVSDRFPLNILLTIPFAWLPQALCMALSALPWVFLTLWLVERLYGSPVALRVAACTPLIYVGREYWPQTVAIPLLLLGVVYKRFQFFSVILNAMVRPPFAFFAGCYYVLRDKQWKIISSALFLGLVLLAFYSRVAFSSHGIIGGYKSNVGNVEPIHALYVGLLSPQRGIIFYTPWIMWTIRYWDRYITLTALYVAAEWIVYDAWGGDSYLGYRYALPLIVMVSPLYRMAPNWVMNWSIGLTVYALFLDSYTNNSARNPNIIDPWLIAYGITFVVIGEITRRVNNAHRIRRT